MSRALLSRLTVALLSSGGALAVATGAYAQAAPMQTAPLSGRDAPAASANQVGEVVVTAQKREERLLDTPVPVTALQPQFLQRTDAVTFSDYLARVPGFNDIGGREGETQLILRGITTGPQPNTTVGTYVDDTPFGSSSVFTNAGSLTPDIDPSDLQRIEVLRGPQGTLYGANTLGGLLKFVTTPPDPTGYHGRVEADGNTVDHGGDGYGLRAMVNIPIIQDKLAIRANVFNREDAGYINDPTLGENGVNQTRVYGGRVSLLWNATDKLSVRLTATSQNLKSPGVPSEDVDMTTRAPLYGRYVQQRFADELLDNRYRVYNGDVHWDLGFATLTSATSYNTLFVNRIADATDVLAKPSADIPPGLVPLYVGAGLITGPDAAALSNPNLGVTNPEPIHQTRFTEEVRLASDPGMRVLGLPIDWQAGFYFDHERGNQQQFYDPFDTSTGAPIALQNSLADLSLRSRYTEYAGFADVTLHITDKFDILGGVRYSENDQHYTQGGGGYLGGGIPFPAEIVSSSSDSSTTFLVTPEYKFDRNNMVYIRIASGYRPGGPNALVPQELAANVPTSFQPDTLVNYEVGYKAALLDHRLTVDLSAFYINWSDVQLLTQVADFTVEGNGGSAVSKGLEGALTYTPLHGLTFSENFAYTDAFITDNATAAGASAGNHLPYVPRWSNNFNADYDWVVVPGWDAYVGASYRFVGDRPNSFATGSTGAIAVEPRLPSYETIDLRAGVTYQRYTLNLFAKNVVDSRGITELSPVNLYADENPYTASLIQPRTFGLAVSAQF